MLYSKLNEAIYLFVDPYFYWGLVLALGILWEVLRSLGRRTRRAKVPIDTDLESES